MTDKPGVAEIRASMEQCVEALEAMLRHSCVADASPEDKFPEDHAAESAALKALATARPPVPVRGGVGMTLLTEEEAREKWCPFSRVMDCLPMNEFCVSANRIAPDDEDAEAAAALCLCVASDCMAWRVHHSETVRTGNLLAVPAGKNNAGTALTKTEPETIKVPYGYCGLAGAPEK